jgi:hypothetical protein
MDLTISSHDTRRERVAYHIVVAAMLIPLVFGFLTYSMREHKQIQNRTRRTRAGTHATHKHCWRYIFLQNVLLK